jgi:Ca2+-binding RTX toxin-like protein
MRRRAFGVGSAVAALLAVGMMTGCEPTGGVVTTAASGVAVTFVAADGQDNEVEVTADADGLFISDATDEITPQGGCTAIDAHEVRCPRSDDRPFKVLISLGDGNDSATNASSESVALDGEGGNDTLEGGDASDVLIGGRGLDHLEGNGGNDVLEDGSPGSPDQDVFAGGSGEDTISYRSDTGGVTVDLDGAADDGRDREHDQVGADVEDISGTDFADRLIGNARANFIAANDGDDVLIGLAGADNLLGGPGTDTCDLGRGGASALDCEA